MHKINRRKALIGLSTSLPVIGVLARKAKASATSSPDERISQASEVIRQALAEKYDRDWDVEVNDPVFLKAQRNFDGPTWVTGEVLIFSVLDPKYSYGRKIAPIYDEFIRGAS